MASKSLTLVSPDGKHTVTVDSPARENHYKWNGYTTPEDAKVESLAPKSGPEVKTPVTGVELPSAGEQSSTDGATPGKPKGK